MRQTWFIPLLLALSSLAIAQPRAVDRIPGAIDGGHRVVLRGNRHIQALPANDRGALDPAERLNGLTLHFKLSAAQQAELDRLLDDQHDPASPRYRAWLTPDEFADRFGLSPADFDKAASWLESQGFHVDYRARGRLAIGFSGTVAQAQSAFQAGIHRYSFGGELHYANASDPTIPEALEPVVSRIGGLDDDQPRPMHRAKPLVNDANNDHFISPGDLAVIYNINPLYAKGFNGSGQKIAVAGGSDFSLDDVQSFRRLFGLSKNDPQKVLVPGYPNPGTSNAGYVGEALLDLEYAGAVAPAATILFVYAPSVLLATYYAIDENLAPVVSYSYGACEGAVSASASTVSVFRSMAQQANAQGITWVASSGDSGAAGCDYGGPGVAAKGLQVNIPASVPEVTAVGGTEFNDATGNYWSRTAAQLTPTALSYIPETAWNEVASLHAIWSTGGGVSTLYPKPAWQTGQGVPSGNSRYVPDISFTASSHDGYLTVGDGDFQVVSGTSAAAPVFAATLAILNQYLVANRIQTTAGVGNANRGLYRLAQTAPSVFHDVTQGSNIVPCLAGSPDCPSSGRIGYNTGVGYDLATGLGSLDVNNFVTLWNGAPAAPAVVSTSTAVSANPASIAVNASTVIAATVRAASGTVSPSGAVSFSFAGKALGTANLSGSGGTATASLTVFGSQLSVGAAVITASYGGSTTFNPSSGSATVSVTAPSTASSVIPIVSPNPVFQQDPDGDGYGWFYTVRLTEIGGGATTLTGFSIAGADHASDIPDWFGATTLPARGTLIANIRSRGLTVPVDRAFVFSGVDAGGQRWTQQVTVPFLPRQVSASLQLTASPDGDVHANGNPNCASDFPYYQQLNLQEQNGVGVQLQKFVANSSDLTDQIATFFGSLRVAPFGTLRAGICWKIGTPPVTIKYQVDGVDPGGNTVTAAISAPFRSVSGSAGAITASRTSIALTGASSQTVTSTVNVNVPAGQAWSVGVFPSNRKASWLVVYPQSGVGPGTVNLSAAGSLTSGPGVYTANLVFQSADTLPQFLNVPVTFTVGGSSAVSITAFANGASFQTGFAPGMILSIFGSRLANSTRAAAAVPLPVSIDGVSVTVNGVLAPLYYVSPSQLNVQLPYEAALGSAVVAVNNNGLVASSTLSVRNTSPGVFTAADSSIVPFPAARRGQPILLFVTGEGETSPMVPTGNPPASTTLLNLLPKPRATFAMTIGGVPVTPFFIGIPYGLVGVTQVNFTVPTNAPLGPQPVVVTIGGIASKAATLTVSPASAANGSAAEPFLTELAAPLFSLPVETDAVWRPER